MAARRARSPPQPARHIGCGGTRAADATEAETASHCGGEVKFQLAAWHSDHQQADE
jgi:hypothetical protein